MIKHLILQKKTKYDGYKRGINSMVYKFFDKKSSGANNFGGASTSVRSEALALRDTQDEMLNQKLAEEYKNELLENLKKEKYNHLS